MILLCPKLNIGGGEISRRCAKETQILGLMIIREGRSSVERVISSFGLIIG